MRFSRHITCPDVQGNRLIIPMCSISENNVIPENGSCCIGKTKKELFLCFVDLHPHILVKRRNFVSLTGMLGNLIIQFLYIGCSGLIFAVHSDILAFKRYHGVSPGNPYAR
jgi:hypothetical protein